MSLSIMGQLSDAGNIFAAISALATAAYGLVDATKVYRGGVSNIGFNFVRSAVTPYVAALQLVNATDPFGTIRANWLNGVTKADQKATVKSLIRLGLTAATASSLAAAAPGVDQAALQAAVDKIDRGVALSEQDITVLGRFDAILDAQMDAGFERADQQYRNAAKVLAGAFAVSLALIGVWIIEGSSVTFSDFSLAFIVGILAIPLAPIAKDISSALGTALTALKATKS
jgi:hypothetical protein